MGIPENISNKRLSKPPRPKRDPDEPLDYTLASKYAEGAPAKAMGFKHRIPGQDTLNSTPTKMESSKRLYYFKKKRMPPPGLESLDYKNARLGGEKQFEESSMTTEEALAVAEAVQFGRHHGGDWEERPGDAPAKDEYGLKTKKEVQSERDEEEQDKAEAWRRAELADRPRWRKEQRHKKVKSTINPYQGIVYAKPKHKKPPVVIKHAEHVHTMSEEDMSRQFADEGDSGELKTPSHRRHKANEERRSWKHRQRKRRHWEDPEEDNVKRVEHMSGGSEMAGSKHMKRAPIVVEQAENVHVGQFAEATKQRFDAAERRAMRRTIVLANIHPAIKEALLRHSGNVQFSDSGVEYPSVPLSWIVAATRGILQMDLDPMEMGGGDMDDDMDDGMEEEQGVDARDVLDDELEDVSEEEAAQLLEVLAHLRHGEDDMGEDQEGDLEDGDMDQPMA